MKKLTAAMVAVAGVAFAASASAATLDDVKAKGHIQCGVSQGLPGFSNADDSGTGPVSTLICAGLSLPFSVTRMQ